MKIFSKNIVVKAPRPTHPNSHHVYIFSIFSWAKAAGPCVELNPVLLLDQSAHDLPWAKP